MVVDVLSADAHQIYLPHEFVTQREIVGRVVELVKRRKASGTRRADNRIDFANRVEQGLDGSFRAEVDPEIAVAVANPNVLRRLSEIAPMLEVHLIADNQIRDLLRREADIAIRHVRPDQPDLIARLVQELTANFYASEDYVARRGRPKSLEEVREHDFVGLGDNERFIAHLRPMGVNLTLKKFRYGSQSGLAAWALVKQGLGISIMADGVANATEGIELLLPDVDPIRFPVWLTTHRELHTSAKIRVVFDFLAKELGNLSFSNSS